MDEPITLQEAANRFGVKVTRLRKAADEGRLDVRRPVGSRDRLVKPSEVRRFLSDGGQARQAAGVAPVAGSPNGAGERYARVIAIAIPKGGTGKTTTTLNLGAALAEAGHRVLLVDFDPQGSLSLSLGYDPDTEGPATTIYHAIRYYVENIEARLGDVIRPIKPNLDLAPADVVLNVANNELVAARQGELVLRELLATVRSAYDFILIDTLPYLGILVDNALYAADEVIIPTQPQFLSTKSIKLIMRTINVLRKSGATPQLRVAGILLTQLQEQRLVDRHYRDTIRAAASENVPVFRTEIKVNATIQKSQGTHPPQTVLDYDPKSEVANAYRALAQEVLHATQVLV